MPGNWVITVSYPPGQNGRHFVEDIFRYIFMNEMFCILIKISLKFIPKGQIDNNQALVEIMAWRRKGNKPLSEPMLIRLTDAYMQHKGEMRLWFAAYMAPSNYLSQWWLVVGWTLTDVMAVQRFGIHYNLFQYNYKNCKKMLNYIFSHCPKMHIFHHLTIFFLFSIIVACTKALPAELEIVPYF